MNIDIYLTKTEKEDLQKIMQKHHVSMSTIADILITTTYIYLQQNGIQKDINKLLEQEYLYKSEWDKHGTIRPKCFKEEEELFAKIKNFLRANPGASITQVAENCDCKEEAVHAFIKSGRLERVGLRRIAHQCELCNATIYEGVMCADCKKKLKDQVKMLKNISSGQK